MATFKVSPDGETGILHSTYKDNKFIDERYKLLLESLINEDDYFYTVYALGEWSALKLSGRIYKKFSDHNILFAENKFIYNPFEAINLCCDFNYDPMKWALLQNKNGNDYIFDELVSKDTDTESQAKLLLEKYPDAMFNVYGDYSGLNRSTRGRSTDYDIIREVLGIRQDQIFVKPNPLITTRVNIVNWRLCNKSQLRKLFVNENCEHVIKDFRRVTWVKNKKVEDQTSADNELSHISSAIGYYINYKYSLKELPKATWRN